MPMPYSRQREARSTGSCSRCTRFLGCDAHCSSNVLGTAKPIYLSEFDPNAVVLVQVLVPLRCAAACSTTLETEVLFPCTRGRLWLLVCPESASWQHLPLAPVQLVGHLLLVLYDEAGDDGSASMTTQEPLTYEHNAVRNLTTAADLSRSSFPLFLY